VNRPRALARRVPATLAATLTGLAVTGPAAAFLDGPPARVTGGFGEDSCESCHFGNPENDATGRLRLHGLPETYEAGRTYELRIELARAGMQAAGFQLAIRDADGQAQAGTLEAPDGDGAAVQLIESRGIRFVQHDRDGAQPKSDDVAVWTVRWTAPAGGRVLAHASAVAGDGDSSQAGDFVFTIEVESVPADTR
jgi:hypothetical protein